MTDVRVQTNNNVEVRIGTAQAIADVKAPTAAELGAMISARTAIRWDQFGLGVQTSNMESDPTLDDEAGAQMRGLLQFGGTMSFINPKPGSTGLRKQIKDLVIKPHTELVVAIRGVLPKATAPAAGQVWNVFRVITDAQRHARADTGYSYSVNFRPRGEAGVNAIVKSAVPTAVTVTPVGGDTATVGTPKCFTAAYEGNNVSIGATWISSDSTVLEILPHGWAIPLKAGTAEVTATYPGSAAGTPVEITVS